MSRASRSRSWWATAAVVSAVLVSSVPVFASEPLAAETGEQLWLHRNLGLAYFANDEFEEARREFSTARQLAPDSPAEARNAGIAALLAGDLAGARIDLEAAAALAPTDPRVLYALGILEKRDGNLDAAVASLRGCAEAGGEGPELRYNLGILAVRQQRLDDAAAEFESVIAEGPLDAPSHYASALYRHGRTLLQLKRIDEGREAMREYQTLVREGKGADLSEEDLERGALLEPQRWLRPRTVRAAGPLPAFRSVPVEGVRGIRWAETADLDGDGDRDLLLGDGQTVRDLRWTDRGWTDVTESRGLAGLLGVSQARALDLDNDGQRDLLLSGGTGLSFHPGVEGAWGPPRTVLDRSVGRFVPVDFDHEGDVDVVAAGTRAPALVLNHGDGTFSDVTEASGLAVVGACVHVEAVDLDNDADVDLVFVTRSGDVVIASNLRGGRFEVQAPLPGTPGGAFSLSTGDVDQDGDVDLAVAAPGGAFLARNEGELRFETASTAVVAGTPRWPSPGGESIWLADLDNDGLLDVLIATETGGKLGVGDGAGSFRETSAPLEGLAAAGAYPVAALPVTGDAKVDLVASTGEFGLAENIGEIPAGVLLDLKGVKNCVDGVGAIVELLSGAGYARADAGGRPIHFGLGRRGSADAARIQWPNGIQQGVTGLKPGETREVEEKAGLVGSCPFLYAWDGEKYEFITDILTVTPLGLPVAPGAYVPPDHDEAIRLTSDQLVPRDGWLDVQVTEELREITYLDQVRLYAIDHPADVEVQPNERFKFPPFPEFGVHVLDGARPPVKATDTRGRDVTEVLYHIDDLVVGDLETTHYQGIVQRHHVVLDFGEVPPDAPLMLHLAGWFYWTNATINLAIAQDPRHDFIPPQLEVRAADGSWRPYDVEVGFPGGKTKSIPVDLTGAFPSGRAEMRIWTTLRLYWDRALLQVGSSGVEPKVTMLLPDAADLHFRGHSEPILSITGEEPERFDYDGMRTTDVPWDPHPGLYTRFGDVTSLLQEPDDMYAIMASGDECTVRWRADRLPALPAGLERTYFLVFDGWAKDGDPNTTWATQVEPLPFHAMSGYPYGEDEAYPDTPEHRAYREGMNTRRAERLTRDLVAEARARAAAEAAGAAVPSTAGTE